MGIQHMDHTVGGLSGHIFRRLIHVGILVVPLLYYAYAEPIANFLHLTPALLILIIFVLNGIVESLRLLFRWTLFGHRHYEKQSISSFAWGVLSVCIVFWLAPDRNLAIPIIWSCAIGDPVLGELRKTKLNRTWIALIGMLTIALIWWFCTLWFGTPWLLGLLMGPLIVGLEWPNVKWIDDNALMQLIPLLIVLILYG